MNETVAASGIAEPWRIVFVLLAGHLAAVASPGPNSAFILQTALHDRRSAWLAALGILPASLLWASLGLAGMGALVAAAPMAQLVLRVGGGCYLCWLGWRMATREARMAPTSAPLQRQPLRLIASGFATNFLNPKSIAWYMSIFAATGAFDLPRAFKTGVVIAMPTLGFLWYLMLGALASSAPVRALLGGSTRGVDLVTGAAMIGFGLKLLILG